MDAVPASTATMSGCPAGSSSMVTSGAITNRLDRLVAKNLIAREFDPENRRSVRLRLTEACRTLINRALLAHVENEEKLLSCLGASQRRELETLLRQLLTAHEAATE